MPRFARAKRGTAAGSHHTAHEKGEIGRGTERTVHNMFTKAAKKEKNFLTPPDSQKKMLTLQPWKKPLARKMNRKATKRHIASWVLLAVFLPMMVFSSLHVHSNGQCSEVQCAECVNHMPHSGHFMAQDSPMHSCVLCQFLSLPFLAAAAMVVAICYTPKHTVNTANRCNVCIALRGSVALRAPPFV